MFSALSNIFKPLTQFFSSLFAPKPSQPSVGTVGFMTKTSTPAYVSPQTIGFTPASQFTRDFATGKIDLKMGVPVSSQSETSKTSSALPMVVKPPQQSQQNQTVSVQPSTRQVSQQIISQPSAQPQPQQPKPQPQPSQQQIQTPSQAKPSGGLVSVPSYVQDVAKQISQNPQLATSEVLTSLYSSLYNLLPQEKRTGLTTPEEYARRFQVQQPQQLQQQQAQQLLPEQMTIQDIVSQYQEAKKMFMPSEEEIRTREEETRQIYQEELNKLIEDIKNAYAVSGFSPNDPIVVRKIEELKTQATPLLLRELANLRRTYEQTAEERAKDVLSQYLEYQKTRLTQEATTRRSLMEKYLDIVKTLENPTDEMRNYQFAVQQGYQGSFADFIMEKNAPEEWKEYQFAQQQGYQGSFLDFLKEKAQAGRDPSAALIAALNLQYKPLEFGIQIQKNMQGDDNIKMFNNLKPQIETFQNLIFNQRPKLRTPQDFNVYDTTLITLISKLTDPTTGVREGELAKWSGLDVPTLQSKISAWSRIIGSRGFLDENSRRVIEDILTKVTNGIIDNAAGSYVYWKRTANQAGVSNFVFDPVLEHMIQNKKRLFPSVYGQTKTTTQIQEIIYKGNRYRGYYNERGDFIAQEIYDKNSGRFVPIQ